MTDKVLMDILEGMTGKKILVMGDMIADIYLEGTISRISREAPVLVLEQAAEVMVPGGAANAVHNAATLKGDIFAVGVVGADSAGEGLKQLLAGKGVHTEGIIVDEKRPTITKTRITAGGQATVRQQVVRIDREDKTPLSDKTEKQMMSYVEKIAPNMGAIVLCDYGSGTITEAVRCFLLDLSRRLGIPCMVDSRYRVLDFVGVSLVKQNEAETAAAVGLATLTDDNLLWAGRTLIEKMKSQAVLVTRGGAGMSLFEENGTVHHIPVSNRSEVYDVSGAGDTAVVTMMLAVAAGASYVDGARLANLAAGVVVRKMGTATTTPEEIKAMMQMASC